MSGLLTSEIREWIGRQEDPVRIEITRRDIIKYSLATEQRDEKYLRGDEAPPMFLFGAEHPLTPIADLRPDGIRRDRLIPELPLPRVMAGGVKQTYHRWLVPGDVVLITRKIADIYEKQGRSGPLIFLEYETEVVTEQGELVMNQTMTRIAR